MTLSTKSLEERLTPSSKQVPVTEVLTEMYRAAQNSVGVVCQIPVPLCHENACQIFTWSLRPLAEGAVICICLFFGRSAVCKNLLKKPISKLLLFLFPPEQKNDTFLKGFRLHKWSKTTWCLNKLCLILVSSTLGTLSVARTALSGADEQLSVSCDLSGRRNFKITFQYVLLWRSSLRNSIL